MRKFLVIAAAFVFPVPAIYLLSAAPQSTEKQDQRFSKRAERLSNAKKGLIGRELKTLNAHPWAGEYYYGDGLGVNVTLSLAPKSGFVFNWHGCLGLYDLNYGEVNEEKDRIKLVSVFPNRREGFEGIAPELVPVIWGARHYLIPSDEMLKFVNSVNSGFEPRNGSWGSFLLRRGDEGKPILGQPVIPPEYRDYLLKQPIQAQISSVKEIHIENNELANRITTAILNVGTAHGVRQGMKFWLYEPSGMYGNATVTSVDRDQSEVTIDQLEARGESHTPSPGWKFSTRSGYDPECKQESLAKPK